jgi:hypothetical protein
VSASATRDDITDIRAHIATHPTARMAHPFTLIYLQRVPGHNVSTELGKDSIFLPTRVLAIRVTRLQLGASPRGESEGPGIGRSRAFRNDESAS